MEEIKLNQERLNKICYILGSYDYDSLFVSYNDIHVWIMLGDENNYIPKFVLDEISEFMGDNWGTCRIGMYLCLLFDKESKDENLSVPKGFKLVEE
ncbi:MAG: hypothetical protein IJE78_04205 [Bacteroidaceae bacterium]|nr:hypothetical protein [Bacteroidaceae bacterium]